VEPPLHVEIIHWDPAECSAAKGGMFLLLSLDRGCRVARFAVYPVYTRGPIPGPPQKLARDSWRRRFKAMRKSKRDGHDSPGQPH